MPVASIQKRDMRTLMYLVEPVESRTRRLPLDRHEPLQVNRYGIRPATRSHVDGVDAVAMERVYHGVGSSRTSAEACYPFNRPATFEHLE